MGKDVHIIIRIMISIYMNSSLTLRAHDGGAALVVPVLDDAVLADGLDEGADVEVAHQHLVVARAVQARLVRHDLLALRVVLELVVATCDICEFVNQLSTNILTTRSEYLLCSRLC